MRTTLDIPEDLLERARISARATTKRETVIAALEELIRKGAREDLRQLAGKLDLDLDIAVSRGRRRR